ncbi:MAG: toll/interleukin-1 receptor domain-containing protein [Thermoanaerobaculia bacterium]
MSVFISYSHSDAEFVDRLAAELIKNRKHVWIDRYEFRAGDSLVDRIQEAITTAGAMLVVLSKASVASEWCKKELSSGLIRELDLKQAKSHLRMSGG